jgi:signal transduction histidine kinase
MGKSGQVVLKGLDVVHQVGLQLQRRRSPGALAQEVIEILESGLGYENTAILLLDRPARQLRPFALSERSYGRDFSRAYESYVASHNLRLGNGVPGWVAHNGRSLLCGDIHRMQRLSNLESEMRSMLFVPIRVEGVVIGTLGAESRLVDAFTPMDQQLLETVAGQIAIAIYNAHLFSRVHRDSPDGIEQPEPRYRNGDQSPASPSERNLAQTAVLDSNGQVKSEPNQDGRIPKMAIGRQDDAAESAESLVADLRAQVEELNAFNHMVAHDLKNPLSILLGFADLLAHDYAANEDEVLDQAIRVIAENGRRIENIINELLLLAEVRTVEQIPMMPLDMRAVVYTTTRRLRNLIKECQAEIILPEFWPLALGHEPWVEEIWINYLSNAIKYGGPAPRVELGGEMLDNGMVRFWLRDHGGGIDPEDQKRLFIPFTKLRQANTKGHGLGLSIVQRITKRLGGDVGVISEVGKGSLFWFTLPAVSTP